MGSEPILSIQVDEFSKVEANTEDLRDPRGFRKWLFHQQSPITQPKSPQPPPVLATLGDKSADRDETVELGKERLLVKVSREN